MTLLGALLIAAALLPPAPAAGVSSDPLQVPRAEIVSGKTKIDRRSRFKVRVRCLAPAGELCAGFVVLLTGIPTLRLSDGTPLTRPRDFKLGAGKARAIRMRLAGYARPDRSAWRKAWAAKALATVQLRNGASDERRIFIRFKPRHRGHQKR